MKDMSSPRRQSVAGPPAAGTQPAAASGTGTIIMGQDVRLAPVAVAHGNLTVSIKATNRAVPAAPLTPGATTVEQNTDVQVTEEERNLVTLKEGASLADVVDGLNQLGATPRDLITILQAIKQAGALRAEVEVI